MKLPALDVTKQARAAGCAAARVAATSGVLAYADHADGGRRERLLGALVRLILEAPGYDRQRLGPGQTSVTTSRGARFVELEGETQQGDPGIAIATWWEWVFASGEIELDVLEEIERKELLQ